MADVSQFRAVGAWRTALGLLPVPLRDTAEKQERYVLLNGTTGNFCLDFVGQIDPNSQRATAWSCDVGHYITCRDESIIVNRWDRQGPEESYSSRSVIAQLHEFHRHLEKTAPDRSRSIVIHILRVFHRIRAVVGEQDNGLRSLRVLLHLLASAAAGYDRLLDADLGLWGLTPEIVEPSQAITEATWRPLYNDLLGVGRYDVLRPDFQLVLRHASGAVFQDAHLEANNSPAFWLPGFELPATVNAKAVPSETGIYFTPPALARTLAEEATTDIQNAAGRPLVLFDPACGSGELLKECLRLLKLRGYLGKVRVVGWDKSPAAVDMARFVLAWEKRAWLSGQVEIDVTQHDSVTAEQWPGAVDILVMNPPFRSWQLMEPEEQAAVTHILGASSKPNMAIAFARRALEVLREGGVLAMVAPNSLLEGASGKDTREAMAESLNPQLVARLGDQSIFARALVDAGLYVGKRKPSPMQPTAILWADSRQNSLNRALRGLRRWRGAEVEPIKGEGFSVYVRRDIATTGDPWIARGYDAWSQYQRFQHSDKTLPANKVFDIRQGVRLGSDVFIVAKEYVRTLGKHERRFFRPAVMNPSIVDGKLSDTYYAFYPYTAGLPPITSEKELEEHVPRYFKDHLLKAKSTLKARKTLERQTELKWWDLLWPRAWQMERNAKIVSKYFGGRRSFAIDRTGDFVVVVGNAWLLKKGEVDQEITDEEFYSAILTYLNSSVAYDMLEYVSIQVAGGQLDLSNRYVGDLPVLNLASLELVDLTKLIEMGITISERTIDRWAEVDELVTSIMNR
ncbi:MAG: N-6 DNA methylase [Acidobacteria bacterium]|nr:N-6 DNA methylase [Acidobacteriota bacterium]